MSSQQKQSECNSGSIRTGFPEIEEITREELVKRLHAFRGMLPADFKFDRDDANAR
jgi:hypothetical protein